MPDNTPQSDTIPYGYCECGCGKKTAIAKSTFEPYGYVAGEPKRFIRGHANRGNISDLTGKRFGRWVVLYIVGPDKHRTTHWFCRCDCGSERSVKGSNLKGGRSRSCGCLNTEVNIKKATIHGMSEHPMYGSWCAMKARCDDKNHKEYHNYGGRGIAVCERWQDSFENFYQDMGERPKNKTLDRIDNNGNYEPDNCRWATATQQHNNSRSARMLTFRGETRPMYEWAAIVGISRITLSNRINRSGWSVERALTEPVHNKSK